MTKRILLADDHHYARQALRELLATRPEWTVCAEAADGIEAVKMAASTRPDVAIVDLQMPRLNGIDAARQILALFPNAPILMISSHEPKLIIEEIMSTPIRGFVSKFSVNSELLPAVETLLAGGSYFALPEQREKSPEVIVEQGTSVVSKETKSPSQAR